MLEQVQPHALPFSEIGPGARWCGNENGSVNDPCWPTYIPKYRNSNKLIPIDPKTGKLVEFPNGASSVREGPSGYRPSATFPCIPAGSTLPTRIIRSALPRT